MTIANHKNNNNGNTQTTTSNTHNIYDALYALKAFTACVKISREAQIEQQQRNKTDAAATITFSLPVLD